MRRKEKHTFYNYQFKHTAVKITDHPNIQTIDVADALGIHPIMFGTLKTEMVYFQKFQQLEEAVAYIAEYIRFYNCERLHSSLGYCTPTQYEANAA
jgi:transposase InsO family protein